MNPGTQRAPDSNFALIERLLHSHSEDDLRAVASNPHLTEDLAKAFLARRDLPGTALQDLSKNANAMKNRAVIVGIVSHPRTPRFVSLPVARHLFPFELMTVAMQPAVPADVKMAIEHILVDKVEQLSLGERITLAKRGPTRVAEALLRDKELRVVETALLNPYLVEACIIRTLMQDEIDIRFVEMIARHPKWSLRTDVRCALLRNANTPMAVALQLAHTLPADVARDALFHSNLPQSVKTYLMAEIQHRAR
ncbi:MAG TPA: hypothetical protein VN577_07380 [Terriglobales bacterium]|nr:hypothetical protein [Terriglobales bacterium]